MEFSAKTRQMLIDELKQSEAITQSLINKIIYSKRLLVEHAEVLDYCLQRIDYTKAAAAIATTSSTTKTDSAPEVRTHYPRGSFRSLKFLRDNLLNLKEGEIFCARNFAVLLGGTILQHLITPEEFSFTSAPSVLLTGGYGALYMIKNAFVFRNKYVEREFDQLINSIDKFGNCIRRNMTYFNEILLMKQQELIESRQIERAWDCITATKEVIEILYDATRKLEGQYAIPDEYIQVVAPMEELRETDYFKNNVTDYSPKHIKDFHNIFSYVQSEFLFRLALTLCTKPSISELNIELNKITCLIKQLVQEEENHFQSITNDMKAKWQMELQNLNAERTKRIRAGPIPVLQDSSLKLSACMVAVAGECQSLDVTLQRLTEAEFNNRDNANQLAEVANSMRSIENALAVCFDDFQRLMLVYNKFLTSKLDENNQSSKSSKTSVNPTSDGDDESSNEDFLRVEISQNRDEATNKSDEFYAYMFDENREKIEKEKASQSQTLENQVADMDKEILNFEKRITRGKFRPVLNQLKDRIGPIRQEMLEKERQVLTAKGINVDELFKKDDDNDDEKLASKQVKFESSVVAEPNSSIKSGKNDENTDGSDSEGSAELEYQRRSKKLKERDNFAEMRNFLAQKQAINIFKLDLPSGSLKAATGDEEIVESEC